MPSLNKAIEGDEGGYGNIYSLAAAVAPISWPAKTVAKKGARVFLLNRKSNRSKKSYDLLSEFCPDADFVNIECDLQSFESVKKASQMIINECIRLNKILNGNDMFENKLNFL